jgi:hypothetical protein
MVPEGKGKEEAEQVSHVVQSTRVRFRAVRSSTPTIKALASGSVFCLDFY